MKSRLVIAAALVVLLGASCRKDPNFDQLSSNLVVATNIDTTANFSSFKTYYISDSISLASSDTKDSILYDDVSKELVATVKSNMDARGFTFVGQNSHPDIGFKMGLIKTTNVGIYYPGWWWGYPGWGWGWWGYYPYYPWSVAYVITTGTVIIDMLDAKDASLLTPQVKVLWTADLSGALGNSESTNVQNGVNAINQAFIQSPAIVTH
jgi:hypothetical protein